MKARARVMDAAWLLWVTTGVSMKLLPLCVILLIG